MKISDGTDSFMSLISSKANNINFKGNTIFLNQQNCSVTMLHQISTTEELLMDDEDGKVACDFADIIKQNYNTDFKPTEIPNEMFYSPNKFNYINIGLEQ